MNRMTARTIVSNKFWIIEMAGEKIGTLQKDRDSFVLLKKNKEYFDTEKQLLAKYPIKFVSQKKLAIAKERKTYEVYEYPTKDKPHNSMWDLKQKLPLYTKSDKSKSFFCAGYYVIKFDKLWSPNHCPKMITLSRYEFMGPFKTKLEQREALKHANTTHR